MGMSGLGTAHTNCSPHKKIRDPFTDPCSDRHLSWNLAGAVEVGLRIAGGGTAQTQKGKKPGMGAGWDLIPGRCMLLSLGRAGWIMLLTGSELERGSGQLTAQPQSLGDGCCRQEGLGPRQGPEFSG